MEQYNGVYDLRFGIRMKYMDKDWKVTPIDFTQAYKYSYIHPNNRETVRGLVVKAIVGLVKGVRPPVITMSTFDAELPEPALVKYRVIEECLNGLGYRTVDAYRCPVGHDRWHFAAAT